ncbi:MAG: RHS repeat domain-containing protein [Spirosomataceae bacterium]
MKKTLFLFLIPFIGYTQAVNNEDRKVSLPTPDAVAMGKYGEIPVDYFTGIPSIQVPIHTLQAGPIQLPIRLQYHASGLRPAEIASWVGQGWALYNGGIISRTVQGIRDEASGGYWSNGSSTTFNGSCFTHPSYPNPLSSMVTAQLDGEPDIFTFSAGEVSGKFYINSTGEVVKIPENDVKITYTLSPSLSDPNRIRQFVVTLTDGTKYIFGENATGYQAIEVSRVNESLFRTASTWKLVRIESADGQYSVDLTYTPESYAYGNRDKEGIFGTSGNLFNKIEVEGHRLTQMVSSTGRDLIRWIPSTMTREDVFSPIVGQKTAYSLSRVEIQQGAFCKKMDFSYQFTSDPTSAASGLDDENKKRLLLTAVQEKSCDSTVVIPPYTFQYDINGNYLPHKLTAGTDHWGYFNGAENNKSFRYNIPYTLLEYYNGFQNIEAVEGGADKTAKSEFSKLGSLTKIQYPSGGFTQFEYEGNVAFDTIQTVNLTDLNLSTSKTSCSNVTTDFSEFTTTLTDVASTFFELNLVNNGTQYCCNSASGSPLPKWVVFSIHQGGTQIFSRTISLSCGQMTQLRGRLPASLQNGVAYTFRINPVNAQGEVKLLQKTQTTNFENRPVGGIRIKKIRHHDGIDPNRDIIKEYEYLDPVFTGRSSGILYNKPVYGFVKNFTTTCNPNVPSVNFTTHFFFDFPPVPLTTFEGYTVAYKSVKESTPGAGFKRYSYFYEPYQSYLELPYAPPQPGISTGNLESESSYSPSGAIKAYTFNSQKSDALTFNNPASNLFVKAYWGTSGGGSQIGLAKVYSLGTKPFRLSSVENNVDGLTTTTQFSYRSDKAHLLPTEIQTTHPDGTVEKQTIEYAQETNNSSLLTRHMIGIPIKKQRLVNQVIQGGEWTIYSTFAGFPRPFLLQRLNPVLNTWETETTFNSYDTWGNPSSLTHRGWSPETYTWNQDLLTQKNYLDFQWQYEYEPNTTLLKKYTEPNGLFTQYAYDKLSRLRSINQYNGKATTTIGYTYSPANNRIRVATDYQTGADLTTEKVLDGLGRTIQLRKIGYGQGGQDVVSQTDYDPAGRVKRDYLPGFGAASSAFTEYSYEDSPLSRPISITRPAPLGMETLTYGNENDHFTQTLTNALGEYTQTFTDTRGRKRSTVQGKEGLLNTTQYQYDDRNNLLSVLPDGRTASDVDFIYRYEYDGRNRLIRKKIPEKAWAEFAYDLRDLPTHRQDGIHPVVFSAYDAYGRVTKTGTVSSLSSTTFVHVLSETEFKSAGLGFGQPYKNTYALFGANGLPNGTFISSEVTQFDPFHRPVAFAGNHILHLAQPTALTTHLSLNARDQITSQSETVHVQSAAYTLAQNYLYDQGGRPTQTQVTWDGSTQTVEETTAYNALDNPLQTKLGGNLQTMDYSYWAGGFLHNINGGTTGSGGLAPTANDWPTENTNQPLFAMELTYLANGNIANWKQQNRGFAFQNYAYTYDALQRIRTATNGTQSQTYQYKDALGNFSSLTRSDLVRNNGAWNLQNIDALTYVYANPLSSKIQSVADASNHPHGYQPNTGSYSYDANGNTTYDPANQISTVYNYLNLPSKFTKDNGATQEVVYDATGRKWQVREFLGNGDTLSQKSYIGSFEFERNSLQRAFHPTGFIQNLGAEINSSGQANGNLEGGKIISTQKLKSGVKSEYIADQSIILLPGFESDPVFHAEIKPKSGYQWNYILRDHLGNTRVVFADKNKDGLIRQDSSEALNEVLSISNYSPFGLELSGSHQNLKQQFEYKFNGKQENGFTGLTDFGGRYLDKHLGVWAQVDPKSESFFNLSTYLGLGSNPLKFIDPTGEEIILWYSKGTDNSGTKFLYEKGKISQKTAIALNYILNTKEGFNYFSQFAKKGQKIAGVVFNQDGKHSNISLNIVDYTFSEDLAQGYSSTLQIDGSLGFRIKNNDEIDFTLNLHSVGQTKESLVETIAHEIGVHGYKSNELIESYKKGGLKNLHTKVNSLTSELQDHRALKEKNLNHPGFKSYNKIQNQLNEKYKNKFNTVFEYESKKYQEKY